VADRTEGTAWPPFETEFAHAWDTPGHTRYQLSCSVLRADKRWTHHPEHRS
jgi:hypothetical protein